MIYLYVGRNTVKALALTKTILGQYNISHFSKTHTSQFITDGAIVGVDLIASAVKEALTSAQPQSISDKDVTLILPQEMFTFGRYVIPEDISGNAITPFIKDKVRTDLNISLENVYYDHLIRNYAGETTLLFYAIQEEIFSKIKESLELVGLRISKVIPETISYYTLFEKTLRKDKKEIILYGSYKEHNSFVYAYDSNGLLKNKKYYLEGDIKESLKAVVDEFTASDTKVNRLILGGKNSSTVRQDLFTKEVGAWTNPLEKIVDNFYKDHLKVLVPDENSGLSVLTYDTCFGAFIFTEENKEFTLLRKESSGGSSLSFKPNFSFGMPSFGNMGGVFNIKTFAIFILSFILSFGLFYGVSNVDFGSLGGNKTVTPSVTPEPSKEPTPEPSPTPAFTRDELQVRILNGSGIPGKAGEVEDILSDAGYTDIVTGNADAFDYEITEVSIKAEFIDALSYLQEDLADYIDLKEASELDEDDNADIVIIVGTDLK